MTSFRPYQVLQTGAGIPLATATQTLNFSSLDPAVWFQFAFGFATEELPVPNQFLDSTTVTLRDSAGTATLVLVTADANGSVWAPPTPGALLLSPSDFSMHLLDYEDHSRLWAYQATYRVTVPLPSSLNGPATLFLDLFDNGDPHRSMTWIGEVPEPSVAALLTVTAVVWLGAFRRRDR